MPASIASNAALPASVLVAVLLAAALHATWNAFAHASTDRLATFALIGVAASAGGAAIIVVSPVPDRSSWAFLAASAVLHTT